MSPVPILPPFPITFPAINEKEIKSSQDDGKSIVTELAHMPDPVDALLAHTLCHQHLFQSVGDHYSHQRCHCNEGQQAI